MYWAFSPVMGPSQKILIPTRGQDVVYGFGMGLFQNLYFLIIYFDFRTSSRRGLWSVFVLRESVVDFNWKISWAYIGVSSAVYPALIALERVRSDSLGSLSR